MQYLDDAKIKEAIANIGYQEDNKSSSCASLLCSVHENESLKCCLFHSAGLVISEDNGELLPLQKDLIKWLLKRFTNPDRIQCPVDTLYLLAKFLEKRINFEIILYGDDSEANPIAESSSTAYSNIILYAIYLLNNKSINQSIIEYLKDKETDLEDFHTQYIQKYSTSKTKCRDEQEVLGELIESIFKAVSQWITQPAISIELERTLLYISVPNLLLSIKKFIPYLYISHLPGIIEAYTIKIAIVIWPDWERISPHLCVRRTSFITHSKNLTEKLSPWLDAGQRKAYLIRGIRSLSLASVFILQDDSD